MHINGALTAEGAEVKTAEGAERLKDGIAFDGMRILVLNLVFVLILRGAAPPR